MTRKTLFSTAIFAVVALTPRLCAFAEAAAPVVIQGFEETPKVEALLTPRSKGVHAERVAEHATEGRWALKLSFPPFHPKKPKWPSATYKLPADGSAPTDWTRFRTVALDVFNPMDEEVEFGISFASGDKGAGYSYWKVSPGESTLVQFNIGLLGANMDCSRVDRIIFWQRLQVLRPQKETTFIIDNIRLTPKTIHDNEAVSIRINAPHFRASIYTTQSAANLVADVTLDINEKDLEGLQAAARLRGLRGEQLGVKQLKAQRGKQSVEFPLPNLSPGEKVAFEAELRDAEGSEIRRFSRQIVRRRKKQDEVTLDTLNRICINGRPFFPIGIYNAAIDDLGLLKRIGFNCVGPYIAATPDYASEAKNHGLRVISSIPRGEAPLTEKVRQLADTNVVLAYYLYDEPAPDEVGRLQRLREQVAADDPYHPTCGCNNLHQGCYGDVIEIMMVDSYPIPGSFRQIIERMDAAIRAMDGRGPVWFIPQAFARMGYCHEGSNLENSREPSFDELRSMTWLGLTMGAQGIVYYSHAIQTFRIRCGYPILWRGLEYVIGELSSLQNVLLWPTSSNLAQCDSNEIYLLAKQNGKELYLAAVSSGATEVEAKITLGEPFATDSKLTVLNESRFVQCENGRFSDRFEPRATHVYTNALRPSEAKNLNDIRAELSSMRAEREKRVEKDVALFYKGAELRASWGFPENVRAHPWKRIIDGYRGTTWPLGVKGSARRQIQWDDTLRQAGRWLEVKLPQPTNLEKAVAITSDFPYHFEILDAGHWRRVEPSSQTDSPDYSPDSLATTRAYDLSGAKTDSVRLFMPEKYDSKRGEIYFEIELYQAGGEP